MTRKERSYLNIDQLSKSLKSKTISSWRFEFGDLYIDVAKYLRSFHHTT